MLSTKSIQNSIVKHSDLVNQLREEFLDRFENAKELYDEMDIKKIRKNDWCVWRFLRSERYNKVTALEKLDKAMKWRKEVDINNRRDTAIPKEFFEVGGMFALNCDKEGTTVIYLRIRVNLKVPKLSSYIKDFISYIIDKVDQQNNENGFVIVFDLTDAGIRNADLDLCSYLISLLRLYFPEGLRYCLVYNFPWILRSIWPLVKMLIPSRSQDLVKFANKGEIMDFIDAEHLPKYLGGLCETNFATYPSGCKSVTEMSEQLDITDKEIQEYLKVFEPNIKETKRILNLLVAKFSRFEA